MDNFHVRNSDLRTEMKMYLSANAKNLCNPDGKGNETKCSMKCIDKDYDDR